MKTAAITLLLFLTGCSRYPANDYECNIEASKAPTAQGAGVAIRACSEKFRSEIVARKLANAIAAREEIDSIISKTKAIKWAAVIAKPEYQAHSVADKIRARDEYFRRFIEPYVAPELQSEYREAFLLNTILSN